MTSQSSEKWFSAVDRGDLAAIRAGMSEYVSLRDKSGETALMRAVRNDNYDVVKILLHNGSSMTNPEGYTALMIAAITDKARCCRALVAKESHMILPNGCTPLMLAAQHNALEAAKALMPYYVTKTDNRGRTALMYAAELGYLPIVEILHTRECKFSSRDHETALSLAILNHHHEVVEFLRASEEDTVAILSESAQLSMSRRSDLDTSIAPYNALNHSTVSQDSSTSDLILSQADLSERLETSKAIALSELNTMNLELKTRIGKLHEDTSELMNRNALLQKENKLLHDHIQELLRQNQELKMELDDGNKRCEDMAERIDELNDLTQTLRTVQPDHSLLESQYELGQRYNALELSIAADPTSVSADLLEKDKEIAALKLQLATCSLPKQISDDSVINLKDIEERNILIDDLKKQLADQLKVATELGADNEMLRQQLSLSKDESSVALSELNAMREELLLLKKELNEKATSFTEASKNQVPKDPSVRIYELEHKLRAHSDDGDEFSWAEEKENLVGLVNVLVNEKDGLQEENELLRERIKELEEGRPSAAEDEQLRDQEVQALHRQIRAQKVELQDLAQQVAGYQALADDLKKSVSGEPAGDDARVAAVEGRRDELQRELQARDAQVDALKSELDTQARLTKERIADLEKENAELRKLASHLDDIRSADEQELAELRGMPQDAPHEPVIAAAEHEAEVALFEAEVKNLHDVNRMQARELQALRAQLANLASANSDMISSISGVPQGDDARVSILDGRVAALQDDVATKEREIEELKKLVGELGDATFSLEQARKDGERLEKEVAKLRDKLSARDQDVKDLEKECEDSRARIKALEEATVEDSAAAKIQSLTGELAARTAEIEELRRQVEDVAGEKDGSQPREPLATKSRDGVAASGMSEEELLDLKNQLECLKTEKVDLEFNLEKAQSTINELNQLLANKAEGKDLSSDILSIRQENQRLHEEALSFTNKEKDDLLTEVSSLKGTINELKEKIDSKKEVTPDEIRGACNMGANTMAKSITIEIAVPRGSVGGSTTASDAVSLSRSLSKSTIQDSQGLDEMTIEELQDLVLSERKRIKKLNNKVTALMTEKNVLTAQMDAMKTSFTKNLSPPQPLQSVAQVPDTATSLDSTRLSDLERALEQEAMRADENAQKASDAKQEVHRLNDKIASLEQELSLLREKLTEADGHIEKLRSEQQKEPVKELVREFVADPQKEEKIHALSAEVDSLKRENAQLNTIKDDLKRQIEDKVKEFQIGLDETRPIAPPPDLDQGKKISDADEPHGAAELVIEPPADVNSSDDMMSRMDRFTTFVTGMCVGASMMSGAQFLQGLLH